jgi:hypothetical protein
MSRVTKKISKMLVCALVLALTFPLIYMVSGSVATSNGENVKVQDHQFIIEEMDPSGKVETVRVMDWMALKGDGTVDVERTIGTGLTKPPKIQNMKGFKAPEIQGDMIIWKGLEAKGTVNVSNVISQSILNKDDVTESTLAEKIPLEVKYSYFMDGKRAKDLKDLAGKSGHFRLECYMKNLSKKKELVTYTDSATGERKSEIAEVYLPLVISPMDWDFDNDIFSNVKTDPTGIISYIPTDFKISWSIPLFPPATKPDNTIWMEADVKNFSMKPLSLTCAFIFPETNQRDPIPEFQASLAQLYGGVQQLGAGLVQMIAGLGSAGMSQTLIWGISQLLGGLEQMADPVAGLPFAELNVRTQFIPGAEELIAGLGSAQTPDTLLYGADQMFSGLSQISAGIGSATTPDSLLEGIGLPTDSATAGQRTLLGALNDIKAGIGDAATPDTLLAGIGNPTDSALAGQLTLFGGLNDIKGGIGSTSTPDTLSSGLFVLYSQLPTFAEGFKPVVAFQTVLPGVTAPANVYTAFQLIYDPTWKDPLAPLFGYATDHQGSVQLLLDGVPGLADGLLVQLTGSPYEPVPPADPSAYQGVLQIQAGIGTPTDSFQTGQETLFGGLNDIKAGIGSATTPNSLLEGIGLPTDSALAGQRTLLGALNDIKGGIGSASTPDTILAGIGLPTDSATAGQLTLLGGLNDIKGGIGSATTPNTLLFGANAIFGGLTQIRAAASTGDMANPGLLEGLQLLDAGLSEAVVGLGSASNSNSLIGGTTQIEDGLEQLKAGVEEASAGVNGQMAPGLAEGLKTLDLTVGQLEAIAQRGDKFDTFLGRVKNKGSTSDMRFLLQTKPVENPYRNLGWLIALVLSLVGATVLVLLGRFAYQKYE